MRKFILAALFIIIATPVMALSYSSPGGPAGFVNDFANILDAGVRQVIDGKLQNLKGTAGAEVAVVTIQSLEGETIENYAVKLFEEWGIGQKGKDGGLLILVAPNEREARIEVGYGLEGDITDLQAGQIVRNIMIPAFKDGDYSKGVSDAVDAVSAIISKSAEAAGYLSVMSGSQGERPADSNINYAALFFFVVIIFNILARFLGKTKSWWLGGVIGACAGAVIGLILGFLYAGIISIFILTVLGLVFDFIVSKKGPGGHGPNNLWFLGHGGHGGFGGGGFGGFGGGMSGGGGASGRW